MGAVRTTYAMIAACIVRRKQCIEMGLGDPFARESRVGASSTGMTPMGSSPIPHTQAAIVLEQGMTLLYCCYFCLKGTLAEMQREHNESLLRLAHILQESKHHSNVPCT